MKKLYILFILLLAGITQNINAQNTCSTSIPLYGGATFTDSLAVGITNTDTTNDYGCLTTYNNQTWLYFKACTSGAITLTLSASSSPSSALDVDFIAWGPISTPTTCGLDSSLIVDCSYSAGVTESIDFPSVVAGQYYKIMVINFSNQPGTFIINQTSGTGSMCTASGCSGSLPLQQICLVSTDAVTNRNTIIWNKDVMFTGFYEIQKETTVAGVYTTLATIPTTDTSVYTDTVSNAMIQAFRYRIATADTCSNMLISTLYHQTIHLLVSASMSTGYPQLSWSPYIGFTPPTYYIYRGASAASLSLYDSISSSYYAYTDVTPATGLTYYSIVVVPPAPCHPSRSTSSDKSFSNVGAALFTGIVENSFADLVISPNPASSELNFSTENNHYRSINFEIYDITGRKLISNLYENTSGAKIDVSNLANGYYVVRFITDKGATQRNIIIAK